VTSLRDVLRRTSVDNYFNYFTEVEEHFQRRRGAGLLLSTLDWALIETWKDAGVPLEAVLRGIDEAFEKYDRRKSKSQKVNSLAYCAQAVLAAVEDMQEAAVGATRPTPEQEGFDAAAVAAYLRKNAVEIERRVAHLPAPAQPVAQQTARSLSEVAEEVSSQAAPNARAMEDLERRLTVMEERLFAALTAAATDAELLAVRAEADRELAPYRSKMPAAQIEQLHKQYANKRLLERHRLPRLSLFYM
jgi:hypothetical protein